MLELISKWLKESEANYVCDYGCGDGEYLSRLIHEVSVKRWYGYDISAGMIERARHILGGKNVELQTIDADGQNLRETFDAVYSSAVFAHISDENALTIYKNIYKHLKNNGLIILCEQTAPRRRIGTTFTRRTIKEYKSLLNESGYDVICSLLIDFWAHRLFFERCIAHIFYAFGNSEGMTETRIKANKSRLFVGLSEFFTKISRPHLFADRENGWGYVFLVGRKR